MVGCVVETVNVVVVVVVVAACCRIPNRARFVGDMLVHHIKVDEDDVDVDVETMAAAMNVTMVRSIAAVG
eukprot:6461528-Amphidinium_carterae.1